MPRVPSRSTLTAPRRQLLEWMRQIYFGSIEELHIEDGEPVLKPPPRVFHEIKFGNLTTKPSEAFMRDFHLKAHVVEFFNFLNDIRDGVVHRIEIKSGLPFRVIVAQDAPRGD